MAAEVEIEATAVVQPSVGKRTVLVTGATGRIGKETTQWETAP